MSITMQSIQHLEPQLVWNYQPTCVHQNTIDNTELISYPVQWVRPASRSPSARGVFYGSPDFFILLLSSSDLAEPTVSHWQRLKDARHVVINILLQLHACGIYTLHRLARQTIWDTVLRAWDVLYSNVVSHQSHQHSLTPDWCISEWFRIDQRNERFVVNMCRKLRETVQVSVKLFTCPR